MKWIHENTGVIGWLLIALFVSAYDPFVIKQNKQSLSRATQKVKRNPFILGLAFGINWHLFGEYPDFIENYRRK